MGRSKQKSDNEYASTEPFSLAVCNRIRWCVGKLDEAVASRKEAFEHRDSMRSQLGQLALTAATAGGRVDPGAMMEAKAKAFDAERAIDDLQHDINFYRRTISETCKQSDSPELDGMLDERPLPTPRVEKPAPPRATKPAVEKDAGVAVGVDEHLAASVNELDLPELQKSRLVRGGYTTVGALAKFVDAAGAQAAEQTAAVVKEFGVADKHAVQLLDALRIYRRKHQRASLEVERDEIAAARGGV